MDAVGRVIAIAPGAPLRAAPVRRAPRRVPVYVIVSFAVTGVLLGLVQVHEFTTSRQRPVPVQPPSPLRAVSDLRPVDITITTPSWGKVRETVTVDRLRTDHTLWRQMHFNDWDRIPEPIRELALLAMIRAYAGVFSGPDVWRHMDAGQWDDIPQPIRSIAYLRMIWHWAILEDVGGEFGLTSEKLAQTIGAIVMAESWFEHRALNENAWGNRDFGLAQCSDHCRETIAAMVARCEILFRPREDDYFNPWIATRIATVWFERELLNAGGDIDLAIRAYHRGLRDALDVKGDAYLARVQRLREHYIRAQARSASWNFVVREISPL